MVNLDKYDRACLYTLKEFHDDMHIQTRDLKRDAIVWWATATQRDAPVRLTMADYYSGKVTVPNWATHAVMA